MIDFRGNSRSYPLIILILRFIYCAYLYALYKLPGHIEVGKSEPGDIEFTNTAFCIIYCWSSKNYYELNAFTFRHHNGKIIGLAFSPNADYLYSAGSLGSLALHDADDTQYRLLRLLGNTVARGDLQAPDALTVSPDGQRVAFVGPTNFTISVVDGRSLDEASFSVHNVFYLILKIIYIFIKIIYTDFRCLLG